MIIGFDVDGVIAKAPLGLHNLLRECQKGWNLLLKTPLGTLVYRKLRFADEEVKELMRQLHSRGHPIVIISYALGDGSKKAKEWLVENEVSFNQIAVPKKGESPLEFKARAILEYHCDFYVEDQLTLVEGILKKIPGVRVIHYRNKEDLSVLKELS